jgi:hypothetical protein
MKEHKVLIEEEKDDEGLKKQRIMCFTGEVANNIQDTKPTSQKRYKVFNWKPVKAMEAWH